MGNARNDWKSSKTSVATCSKRERAWVSQHPPVHHPKNPVLGFHGWDETVPQGSVYLVSIFFFLLLLFFPARFFSLAQFFFPGNSFFITFFLAHPWPQVFFGGSSYLPQPPTALLPTNPPTSLIHAGPLPHSPPFALTSIARASDLERIWVAQSFRSAMYPRTSRVGSFMSATHCQKLQLVGWKLQCGGNRSAKARGVEVGAWK